MSPDSKFTRFRCITCESKAYPIHEMVPVKDIPVINFHKNNGCELEYFTADQYKAYLQSVTPDSNTSTSIGDKKKRRSLQWFIHKARIKNRMGFDFSREDFPEISDGNFRQYVHRATEKGLIEMSIPSIVPSYRVIGESTGKSYGVVTLKRMGVGLEFEKILRDTCIAYPKIHDIRLKINIEGLHEHLSKSYPVGKSNSRIVLGTVKLRPFIFATIIAYPNTIEIIIACSRMPIIYDTQGAQDFILMLSEIREKLYFKTKYNSNVYIPSVLDWIVTQYHFNKDGQSRHYSGEHFEVKVKDMSAGLIRFYDKLFPDGVTRTRLEQIRSPQTMVLDMTAEMIMTDHYVHNASGIKLTHEQARKILDIIPQSSFVPEYINQFSKQPIIIMMGGSSLFNPMQDGVFSF